MKIFKKVLLTTFLFLSLSSVAYAHEGGGDSLGNIFKPITDLFQQFTGAGQAEKTREEMRNNPGNTQSA